MAAILIFVLLSVMLAALFTAVQIVWRAFRRRRLAISEEKPLGRMFMRNLEGAMELWSYGWP